MTRFYGFSLLEVLVTLMLITGTTLTLIEQQWRLNRLLNQLMTSSFQLVLRDNQNDKAVRD